jgi:hypothetical protein
VVVDLSDKKVAGLREEMGALPERVPVEEVSVEEAKTYLGLEDKDDVLDPQASTDPGAPVAPPADTKKKGDA